MRQNDNRKPDITHFYLNLLRDRPYTDCGRALYNIVNTWKLARGGCLFEENFDRIDFGNVSLNDIRFSDNGECACSFRGTVLNAVNLMSGHSDAITCAAFTPDGRYIVTGSYDNTAIIWETDSGLIHAILTGHRNTIDCVTFSSDGKYCLTASADYTAKLWDTETGKCVDTFSGSASDVRRVHFLPDDDYFLAVHANGIIEKWSVNGKKCVDTLKTHTDDDDVLNASFSNDGKYCSIVCHGATAQLWDVEQGECVIQEYIDITGIAQISPDNQYYMTCLDHGRIQMWDIKTGNCLYTLQTHDGEITCARFLPDSQSFVAGSQRAIKLWSSHEGEWIRDFSNRGAHAEVTGADILEISPDGQMLVTGEWFRPAKLWSVETGSCLHILEGTHDNIYAKFSSDGKLFLNSDQESSAKLWFVDSGRCAASLNSYVSNVGIVQFSPDNELCALGTEAGNITLMSLKTGKCIYSSKEDNERISAIAFSRDSRFCLTGAWDETAKLWSVATGECIHTFCPRDTVDIVQFSPDGKLCAMGGYYYNDISRYLSHYQSDDVKIYSAETGEYITAFHGQTGTIHAMAFSYDNQMFLEARDKQAILRSLDPAKCPLFKRQKDSLWLMGSDHCMYILEGHTATITAAAFSPDGKLCLTGAADSTARLWSVADGKCVHVLEGHTDKIHSVQFSEDGTICITEANDYQRRSWLTATGECIEVGRGYAVGDENTDLSPDRQYALIGGHTGIAKLFDLKTEEEVDTYYSIVGLHIRGCDFSGVRANDVVKKILYQNDTAL